MSDLDFTLANIKNLLNASEELSLVLITLHSQNVPGLDISPLLEQLHSQLGDISLLIGVNLYQADISPRLLPPLNR